MPVFSFEFIPQCSWAFDTFPSCRDALHYRCDRQARSRGHRRRSTGGPAEESGGHPAGRHQHQRALYVVRVPQPPARHHQQPVRPGEDTRRKLRSAAAGLTYWMMRGRREIGHVCWLSVQRVESFIHNGFMLKPVSLSPGVALVFPHNHITVHCRHTNTEALASTGFPLQNLFTCLWEYLVVI